MICKECSRKARAQRDRCKSDAPKGAALMAQRESKNEKGDLEMDEIIKNATELFTLGLITRDELASMIAKEYAELWARGQLLSILGLD